MHTRRHQPDISANKRCAHDPLPRLESIPKLKGNMDTETLRRIWNTAQILQMRPRDGLDPDQDRDQARDCDPPHPSPPLPRHPHPTLRQRPRPKPRPSPTLNHPPPRPKPRPETGDRRLRPPMPPSHGNGPPPAGILSRNAPAPQMVCPHENAAFSLPRRPTCGTVAAAALRMENAACSFPRCPPWNNCRCRISNGKCCMFASPPPPLWEQRLLPQF